jgi:hypothetical protein
MKEVAELAWRLTCYELEDTAHVALVGETRAGRRGRLDRPGRPATRGKQTAPAGGSCIGP